MPGLNGASNFLIFSKYFQAYIQYKNISLYINFYNRRLMKNDQTSNRNTISKIRTAFSILLILLISAISDSCTKKPAAILKLTISETAGMSRSLEYIEVEVPLNVNLQAKEDICLKEAGDRKPIAGQIIDTLTRESGRKYLKCIFPVSIEANTTKSYEIIYGSAELQNEVLKYTGHDINMKIENTAFIADLTDIKATAENGLGSGQLAGLILKDFNDQLLQRGHINMHWAPNFQRDGLEYKTFGHMRHPDTLEVVKGPYIFSLHRSGSVPGYDEIEVSCMYQFYAGLPYFTFSSEILIKDDVELMLLRNDEMTMDSLFTHVTFLNPDGEVSTVDLYQGDGIEQLEKDPIPDDAKWLFFQNKNKQYAFGSIRLEYDNTNLSGSISPLYGEHTKITRSAGNGRYWNRRLINDHNTLIPSGSRYREKNAYLIFNTNNEDGTYKLEEYHKRLIQPLIIQYIQ